MIARKLFGALLLLLFVCPLNAVDYDLIRYVPIDVVVNGNTALQRAVLRNDTASMRWMIEHGADVNAKNWDDCTALHTACSWVKVDCVKFLLGEPNIDVNATESMDYTPLHEILAEGVCNDEKLEIVCLLALSKDIEKSLSTRARAGCMTPFITPLEMAYKNGDVRVIEILKEEPPERILKAKKMLEILEARKTKVPKRW